MFFTSRSARKLNADGTHNVFCFGCGDFISRTYAPMSRALCELCRRIENGEEITPQAVKEYRLAKGGQGMVDISVLLVPQDDQPKKFSLRSMAGDILEAVHLPRVITKKPESQVLANRKKRKRLFDEMDPEPMVLGSMQDLDQKLKEET